MSYFWILGKVTFAGVATHRNGRPGNKFGLAPETHIPWIPLNPLKGGPNKKTLNNADRNILIWCGKREHNTSCLSNVKIAIYFTQTSRKLLYLPDFFMSKRTNATIVYCCIFSKIQHALRCCQFFLFIPGSVFFPMSAHKVPNDGCCCFHPVWAWLTWILQQFLFLKKNFHSCRENFSIFSSQKRQN